MRPSTPHRKLILIIGVILLFYGKQYTEVTVYPAGPKQGLVCTVTLKTEILEYVKGVFSLNYQELR